MNTNSLEQAGKEELRDELLKIKARQKRLQEDNKAKAAATVATVATIGTAGVMSWIMGGKEAEVRKEHADFDQMSQEDRNKLLEEKQAMIDSLIRAKKIA